MGANGRPLEVRFSFVLALWLLLGCLVPNEEVMALFVYMHVVGAERMGAALDVLLEELDIDDTVVLTPSVLRRKLLEHAPARSRA